MAKNSQKEKAEQLGKRAVPSNFPNLAMTNHPWVIAALSETMSKVPPVDPSKLKF